MMPVATRKPKRLRSLRRPGSRAGRTLPATASPSVLLTTPAPSDAFPASPLVRKPGIDDKSDPDLAPNKVCGHSPKGVLYVPVGRRVRSVDGLLRPSPLGEAFGPGVVPSAVGKSEAPHSAEGGRDPAILQRIPSTQPVGRKQQQKRRQRDKQRNQVTGLHSSTLAHGASFSLGDEAAASGPVTGRQGVPGLDPTSGAPDRANWPSPPLSAADVFSPSDCKISTTCPPPTSQTGPGKTILSGTDMSPQGPGGTLGEVDRPVLPPKLPPTTPLPSTCAGQRPRGGTDTVPEAAGSQPTSKSAGHSRGCKDIGLPSSGKQTDSKLKDWHVTDKKTSRDAATAVSYRGLSRQETLTPAQLQQPTRGHKRSDGVPPTRQGHRVVWKATKAMSGTNSASPRTTDDGSAVQSVSTSEALITNATASRCSSGSAEPQKMGEATWLLKKNSDLVHRARVPAYYKRLPAKGAGGIAVAGGSDSVMQRSLNGSTRPSTATAWEGDRQLAGLDLPVSRSPSAAAPPDPGKAETGDNMTSATLELHDPDRSSGQSGRSVDSSGKVGATSPDHVPGHSVSSATPPFQELPPNRAADPDAADQRRAAQPVSATLPRSGQLSRPGFQPETAPSGQMAGASEAQSCPPKPGPKRGGSADPGFLTCREPNEDFPKGHRETEEDARGRAGSVEHPARPTIVARSRCVVSQNPTAVEPDPRGALANASAHSAAQPVHGGRSTADQHPCRADQPHLLPSRETSRQLSNRRQPGARIPRGHSNNWHQEFCNRQGGGLLATVISDKGPSFPPLRAPQPRHVCEPRMTQQVPAVLRPCNSSLHPSLLGVAGGLMRHSPAHAQVPSPDPCAATPAARADQQRQPRQGGLLQHSASWANKWDSGAGAGVPVFSAAGVAVLDREQPGLLSLAKEVLGQRRERPATRTLQTCCTTGLLDAKEERVAKEAPSHTKASPGSASFPASTTTLKLDQQHQQQLRRVLSEAVFGQERVACQQRPGCGCLRCLTANAALQLASTAGSGLLATLLSSSSSLLLRFPSGSIAHTRGPAGARSTVKEHTKTTVGSVSPSLRASSSHPGDECCRKTKRETSESSPCVTLDSSSSMPGRPDSSFRTPASEPLHVLQPPLSFSEQRDGLPSLDARPGGSDSHTALSLKEPETGLPSGSVVPQKRASGPARVSQQQRRSPGKSGLMFGSGQRAVPEPDAASGVAARCLPATRSGNSESPGHCASGPLLQEQEADPGPSKGAATLPEAATEVTGSPCNKKPSYGPSNARVKPKQKDRRSPREGETEMGSVGPRLSSGDRTAALLSRFTWLLHQHMQEATKGNAGQHGKKSTQLDGQSIGRCSGESLEDEETLPAFRTGKPAVQVGQQQRDSAVKGLQHPVDTRCPTESRACTVQQPGSRHAQVSGGGFPTTTCQENGTECASDYGLATSGFQTSEAALSGQAAERHCTDGKSTAPDGKVRKQYGLIAGAGTEDQQATLHEACQERRVTAAGRLLALSDGGASAPETKEEDCQPLKDFQNASLPEADHVAASGESTEMVGQRAWNGSRPHPRMAEHSEETNSAAARASSANTDPQGRPREGARVSDPMELANELLDNPCHSYQPQGRAREQKRDSTRTLQTQGTGPGTLSPAGACPVCATNSRAGVLSATSPSRGFRSYSQQLLLQHARSSRVHNNVDSRSSGLAIFAGQTDSTNARTRCATASDCLPVFGLSGRTGIGGAAATGSDSLGLRNTRVSSESLAVQLRRGSSGGLTERGPPGIPRQGEGPGSSSSQLQGLQHSGLPPAGETDTRLLKLGTNESKLLDGGLLQRPSQCIIDCLRNHGDRFRQMANSSRSLAGAESARKALTDVLEKLLATATQQQQKTTCATQVSSVATESKARNDSRFNQAPDEKSDPRGKVCESLIASDDKGSGRRPSDRAGIPTVVASRQAISQRAQQEQLHRQARQQTPQRRQPWLLPESEIAGGEGSKKLSGEPAKVSSFAPAPRDLRDSSQKKQALVAVVCKELRKLRKHLEKRAQQRAPEEMEHTPEFYRLDLLGHDTLAGEPPYQAPVSLSESHRRPLPTSQIQRAPAFDRGPQLERPGTGSSSDRGGTGVASGREDGNTPGSINATGIAAHSHPEAVPGTIFSAYSLQTPAGTLPSTSAFISATPAPRLPSDGGHGTQIRHTLSAPHPLHPSPRSVQTQPAAPDTDPGLLRLLATSAAATAVRNAESYLQFRRAQETLKGCRGADAAGHTSTVVRQPVSASVEQRSSWTGKVEFTHSGGHQSPRENSVDLRTATKSAVNGAGVQHVERNLEASGTCLTPTDRSTPQLTLPEVHLLQSGLSRSPNKREDFKQSQREEPVLQEVRLPTWTALRNGRGGFSPLLDTAARKAAGLASHGHLQSLPANETSKEKQSPRALLSESFGRSSSASPLTRDLAIRPSSPLEGTKPRRLTPPVGTGFDTARKCGYWSPARLSPGPSDPVVSRSAVAMFSVPVSTLVPATAPSIPKKSSTHQVPSLHRHPKRGGDTEALDRIRTDSVGNAYKEAESSRGLNRTESPADGLSKKQQPDNPNHVSRVAESADALPNSKLGGAEELLQGDSLTLHSVSAAPTEKRETEGWKKLIHNVTRHSSLKPEEISQPAKPSTFQSTRRESFVSSATFLEGPATDASHAAGRVEPAQPSGPDPQSGTSAPTVKHLQEYALARDPSGTGATGGLAGAHARQTDRRLDSNTAKTTCKRQVEHGAPVFEKSTAGSTVPERRGSEVSLSGAARQGGGPKAEALGKVPAPRTVPRTDFPSLACLGGSGGGSCAPLYVPDDGKNTCRQRPNGGLPMHGNVPLEEQAGWRHSGLQPRLPVHRAQEPLARAEPTATATAISSTASYDRFPSFKREFLTAQEASVFNGSKLQQATCHEVSTTGRQQFSGPCQEGMPTTDVGATDFESQIKSLLPPALSGLQSDTVYVSWGLPAEESQGAKGICVEQALSPKHEYILLDIPLSIVAPAFFRVSMENCGAGADSGGRSDHFTGVSLSPSFLEPTNSYGARDIGFVPPPPLPGSSGGRGSVSSCSFFPSPNPLAIATTQTSASLLPTSAAHQEQHHLRALAAASAYPTHAASSGNAPTSARQLSSPPGALFSLFPLQPSPPQNEFGSSSSSSQPGFSGPTRDLFYHAKTGASFPPPPVRPHTGKPEQQPLFTQQPQQAPQGAQPVPTPQTSFTAPGPQRILQLPQHHPRTHSVPPLLHPDHPAQLSSRHLAPPPPQQPQMHRLFSPGLSHGSVLAGLPPEPRSHRGSTSAPNAPAISLQQPQSGQMDTSSQAPYGYLGRAAWWGFSAPAVALEEKLNRALLGNAGSAKTVNQNLQKNAAFHSTPLVACPISEGHVARGSAAPAGSVESTTRNSGARTSATTLTPFPVPGPPVFSRSLSGVASSGSHVTEYGFFVSGTPLPRGPSLLPGMEAAAARSVGGLTDVTAGASSRNAAVPAVVSISAPAAKSARLAGLHLSPEPPFVSCRGTADTATAATTAGLLLECAPLLRCIDCASRTLVFVDTHSLQAQTKPPAAFAVQQELVRTLLRQALQAFMADYESDLQCRLQRKIRRKRREQRKNETGLLGRRATYGSTSEQEQEATTREAATGDYPVNPNSRATEQSFLHGSLNNPSEEASASAEQAVSAAHHSEVQPSSLSLYPLATAIDTQPGGASVPQETPDAQYRSLAEDTLFRARERALGPTSGPDQQLVTCKIIRTCKAPAATSEDVSNKTVKTTSLDSRVPLAFQDPNKKCLMNKTEVTAPDEEARRAEEKQGLAAASPPAGSAKERTAELVEPREHATCKDSSSTGPAVSNVTLPRRLPSTEKPNYPEQSWGAYAPLGDLRHGSARQGGLSEIRLMSLLRAESYRGEILRRQLQREQSLLLQRQQSHSLSCRNPSDIRSRLRRHTYHGTQAEAFGGCRTLFLFDEQSPDAVNTASGKVPDQAVQLSEDAEPCPDSIPDRRSVLLELWRRGEEASLRALLSQMYKEQTAVRAQIEHQQYRLQQWREAAELQVREQQVEEAMQAFSLTRREATSLLQHTDEGLALYDVFCSQAAALRAARPKGEASTRGTEVEVTGRRCQSTPRSGSSIAIACLRGLTKGTDLESGSAPREARVTIPQSRHAPTNTANQKRDAADNRDACGHSVRVLTGTHERAVASEDWGGHAGSFGVIARGDTAHTGDDQYINRDIDGEELWLENWRKRWDRHWAGTAPPLIFRFPGSAAARHRGKEDGLDRNEERVAKRRETNRQVASTGEAFTEASDRAFAARSGRCISPTEREQRRGEQTYSSPSAQESVSQRTKAQAERSTALFSTEKDRMSLREWMEDKPDSSPRLWWLVPKGAVCANCGRSQRDMALSCMGDVAHLSLGLRVGARTRAEAAEAALQPASATNAGTGFCPAPDLGPTPAHPVTGNASADATELTGPTVDGSVSDAASRNASGGQGSLRVEGDTGEVPRPTTTTHDQQLRLNLGQAPPRDTRVNEALLVPGHGPLQEPRRLSSPDTAENSGQEQTFPSTCQSITCSSVSFSRSNGSLNCALSRGTSEAAQRASTNTFSEPAVFGSGGNYESNQPTGLYLEAGWARTVAPESDARDGRNVSAVSARQDVLDAVCGYSGDTFSELTSSWVGGVASEVKTADQRESAKHDAEDVRGGALLERSLWASGTYCGCHLSPEDAVAEAASFGGASLSSPSSRSSRDSSSPGSPTDDVSKKFYESGSKKEGSDLWNRGTSGTLKQARDLNNAGSAQASCERQAPVRVCVPHLPATLGISEGQSPCDTSWAPRTDPPYPSREKERRNVSAETGGEAVVFCRGGVMEQRVSLLAAGRMARHLELLNEDTFALFAHIVMRLPARVLEVCAPPFFEFLFRLRDCWARQLLLLPPKGQYSLGLNQFQHQLQQELQREQVYRETVLQPIISQRLRQLLALALKNYHEYRRRKRRGALGEAVNQAPSPA